MFLRKTLILLLLAGHCGWAMAAPDQPLDAAGGKLLDRYSASAQTAIEVTRSGMASVFDKGLSFIGVKYRFGGTSPESGFDCSGLVQRVFGDALGLSLPRSAAEMAKLGEKVGKSDLKPGDLVFFNTMRRTFSHVGIYLGDDKFLHSPSKGSSVRVEKIDTRYWAQRFNGARRVVEEADKEALMANTAVAPKAEVALP